MYHYILIFCPLAKVGSLVSEVCFFLLVAQKIILDFPSKKLTLN